MWTWVARGRNLLARTHRNSIPMLDLIKMLEQSKPVPVRGQSVFLTNDPTSAPSSLMHNLKHNKVLHERVVLLNVRNETTPRVAAAQSIRNEKALIRFHVGHASFRLYGATAHPTGVGGDAKGRTEVRHHDDVILLGRRTLKTAANSGMPQWQDKLFIAMTKQAASTPDFFNLPSDRVVELGAQMKVCTDSGPSRPILALPTPSPFYPQISAPVCLVQARAR